MRGAGLSLEPLEEHEQEAVIAALRARAADDGRRRRRRRLVVGTGAALASFYLALAFAQARAPWALPHLTPFAETLPNESAVVGELGGAAAAAAGAAAVATFGRGAPALSTRFLNMSVTLAGLQAVFWLAAASRVLPEVPWTAAWMPVLPAMWVYCVVSAIDDLGRFEPGFAALGAARYRHKGA